MRPQSKLQPNMAGNKSLVRGFAALLLALVKGDAIASEGVGNLYALGVNGSQAGYLLVPGAYVKCDFFQYRGIRTSMPWHRCRN